MTKWRCVVYFPTFGNHLVSFQTSVRFNVTVTVKVSMTLLLLQYLWLLWCRVCETRWPNYLRQDLKGLTFSIIPVSHPSHQVPICRVFFFFLYDFPWPPAAAHGTCLLMALVVVPMANMTRKIKVIVLHRSWVSQSWKLGILLPGLYPWQYMNHSQEWGICRTGNWQLGIKQALGI